MQPPAIFYDFTGAVEVHYCTIDSTNTFAKRWLKTSTPPEGTIIRAEEQTQGRGRRGRAWTSLPGSSLLATMVLYPRFLDPSDHYYLNMAFILAVHDVVETFAGNNQRFQIKWPNDLMRDGRKLAGVLPESAVQNGEFAWYVAGCGLNVNQLQPHHDHPNAISLRMITGKKVKLSLFSPVLREKFLNYYTMLVQSQRDKIIERFFSLLYGTAESADFLNDSGKRFRGYIKQVNPDGSLRVENTEGRYLHITFDQWRIAYPA